MGRDSRIEWTDHTFNPFVGCTKVSEACAGCYAETWAKRSGLVEWGPKGTRKRTRPENWKQPLKWNRDAAAAGVRAKVFCASLGDVMEDHPTIEPAWRSDLWELIEETPHLDWLLLTKRPENIERFGPAKIADNMVFGATAEHQDAYRARWLYLRRLAEAGHRTFLSMEPLLGLVDLDLQADGPKPRLVIVGGESGPKARHTHPDHVRTIRDQCDRAGVAFHFKQWGEWAPAPEHMNFTEAEAFAAGRKVIPLSSGHTMVHMGKKAAGRLLDGQEHDGQIPPLPVAA